MTKSDRPRAGTALNAELDATGTGGVAGTCTAASLVESASAAGGSLRIVVTGGTLVAVARQAVLMKDNKLPRAGKALFADSAATVAGAIVGTSTTTSFVESTSGVGVGGRTGFTAVVTAGFFLLALFFSPLLQVVTLEVTAPALIIVGVLMSTALKDIEWDRFEIAEIGRAHV